MRTTGCCASYTRTVDPKAPPSRPAGTPAGMRTPLGTGPAPPPTPSRAAPGGSTPRASTKPPASRPPARPARRTGPPAPRPKSAAHRPVRRDPGLPQVHWTQEGAAVLWFTAVFAAAALALSENLVVVLAATTFGCAWAARFPCLRNLERVDARRTGPLRAQVGRRTPLAYDVTSTTEDTAVGVQVVDRLPNAARPRTVLLDVEALGPADAEPVSRTVDVVFQERGRASLGALRISTRYPLGLAEASRRLPSPHVVLVRPREGRPTPRLRHRLGGRETQSVRVSPHAQGEDLWYGIRDFRDGDDPRRIHWRTTARRGVRTFTEWRPEIGREAVVLLGRARDPSPRAHVDFERAVSVAATVWRTCVRQGMVARLALGDAGDGTRSHRGLARGLDALALVPARGGRRPRGALGRLAGSSRGRLVVYVAAGPEPGVEARLQQAAGRAGSALLLRADRPDIRRWVAGLP